MANNNPLKQYARTNKLYVKLPTQSLYYPEKMLEYSPNGEVGVKALTASDDMMLSNTDALLNGDAVFQVLKSCVSCKDVKSLLYPDVNTLLLAIRAASRGDKLKFTTNCPNPEIDEDNAHEHEEEVSIRMLLDATVTIDSVKESTEYVIDTEDGSKLKVYIKPSPYTDMSNANMLMYEQARLIQYFKNNSDDVSEDEQRSKMKEAFDKLVKFQQKVLVNSIEKIDLIQINSGEEIVTPVTDRGHIAEFVHDMEDEHAKKLNEKLETLNQNIGTPDTIETKCKTCNHVFEMEVKYDPTNFSEDNFYTNAVKK